MKLRYKILYMSFGAGLVVLGMVLNSLVSGDAEAQVGVKDGHFRFISCEGIVVSGGLFISDEKNRARGSFGLDDNGDVFLDIYSDNGKKVAYLGGNVAQNSEMIFTLQSKSKTDKREASITINENGGRFDSNNKMGESVVRIGVGDDGRGVVDTRDKFGYKR